MRRGGDDEREFGVPFPGRVLPRKHWAKTALKQLPSPGPVDWAGVFGRAGPLVVDLGCGNGRFVLGSAVARPTWNHVGIDVLPMSLRYATRRANQRGLAQVRFAAVDAERFVRDSLADASVREIHCYHPQPQPERNPNGQRLLGPAFLADVVRVLEPGGRFVVQTDNRPYWDYLTAILPAFFTFVPRTEPWPDAPRGRTRREILARAKGMPIWRGVGAPLALTPEAVRALVATLPPPTFDAGPPMPADRDE